MNPSTHLPIYQLTLTAMAHGGAALGRHEDRVIFVPGAIPGETVRVEVVEDKGRFARARLLEVLEPSPDRVTPRCPHVPECGGCQWQHVAYPRQLSLKAEVLRDQLARVGGVADPPVRPTLPAPAPWGYRNRVTFSAGADDQLGFQRAASHDVLPIQECHIADPRLIALYDDLDLDLPSLIRLTLMTGSDEDDLLMAFETECDRPPELQVDFPVSCVHLVSGEQAVPVNLIGHNHVTQRVAGHAYRVSAGRFFQVNTVVAEMLVELTLEWLDPAPDDAILDAYCGVGLFTLPLAQRAGLVMAVELDPGATEDLVDALVESGPPRLVYVSCDPATLARDVKRLARGGYVLADAQPVDMFPQTFHVETVALLIR
jgi:23S rRNA (uracil1939-C5)-methyltransferase